MTAVLRERGISFAVIGAAAMAVHGVTRSTRDLDLLTLARECLETATWSSPGIGQLRAVIRQGDADDPLAGVVRFTAGGEHPLDLIVGKSAWQAGVLARAREATIEGIRVPAAGPADVILLKLFAGGPQDAWDIEQLLAGPDRSALVAEVEAGLGALPDDSRRLWARVRAGERA